MDFLKNLTVNQGLRLLSGSMLLFIFLFGILGSDVGFLWKLLILFMAINQIQSAFTNWCPAITMLKNLGLKEDC
ncbi:MAG: YgaP family membrane protein [Hydrogenobaculum sp.]